MEHCQFEARKPVRYHIHTSVSPGMAKPDPTLPAYHAVCRAASLFARSRFWSFSQQNSSVIKSDYGLGNLVLSKPTEGSVAKLASMLTLALASPAVADDGGGNGADYSDGDQGQKHTAFTAIGLPPGVTIDPATGVISGVVDRNAITDGKMTYDAQISIQDINGASGRFCIKIVLPNKAPSAAEDRALVSPGTSSVISVLENDTDGDGDELAILWAKSAQSNVVSIEVNSLKYTAAGVASNDDIITYEISDGHGGNAVGYVRASTVK